MPLPDLLRRGRALPYRDFVHLEPIAVFERVDGDDVTQIIGTVISDGRFVDRFGTTLGVLKYLHRVRHKAGGINIYRKAIGVLFESALDAPTPTKVYDFRWIIHQDAVGYGMTDGTRVLKSEVRQFATSSSGLYAHGIPDGLPLFAPLLRFEVTASETSEE